MSCSVDISRSEVITVWGTMGENNFWRCKYYFHQFINLCIYIFMKFFLNLVNYMRMFHKYLVKTRVHKKFEIRILPQKLFHPIVFFILTFLGGKGKRARSGKATFSCTRMALGTLSDCHCCRIGFLLQFPTSWRAF